MVPCLFLGKLLWAFHTCLSASDICAHPTFPLVAFPSALQVPLWLPSHPHCTSFPSATASLLSPDFGYMVSLLPFFSASSECWCRTPPRIHGLGWASSSVSLLPAMYPLLGYQSHLLRCNVLSPADTSEALKQIAVRSKMSLIKGNLARSMFLADGSFLLVKYSWWTSLICWCGQEENHIQKRNSKRRLCQSIHTSCKSLSFFQVYF